MTKERIQELTRYKEFIKNRLEAPIPDKHKDHPNEFRAYLTNELRMVTAKLTEAKLQ